MLLLPLAFGGRAWNADAAPANDHFADATVIAGITNLTASNAGATIEPGEISHAGEPAANSVWWKWTAPFTGTFRVVTSNSFVSDRIPLDTVVAVYQGEAITNLSGVVFNDDTPYGEFGALWSRVAFRAHAGETFRIVVGSLGNTGTIRLDIGEGGPFMTPWQALDLQGQPLYSTNFLGKVVVIDFWETICGACIEELPDLISVQTLFEPRGFTFIGLSGDGKVQIVTDYLQTHPVNYPIAMSTIALQYIIAGTEVGYPTKFVVDQEGRIVGTFLGGNTQKYYRSILEPLFRSNSQVRARIARVGASVRVFWPSAESAYSLQGSASPEGPWSDITVTPVTINNELAVTLPGTDLRGFYRLVKR